MNVRDDRVVDPSGPLHGRLRMPGDKSVSHRAAMLAAVAAGESTIEGFLCSEDCLHTLAAVEALGAGVRREGDRVVVVGTGGSLRAPTRELDLGNSGTGLRLLAGLVAGQPITCEMTGDASLCSRPMARIREPLSRMGARVELLGPAGCAPLRISGGRLRAIDYRLPVASAQVKSCVLLAGLCAGGTTRVVEPLPTRDHTEVMLRSMGVDVRTDGGCITIEGAGPSAPLLAPLSCVVPGDFSAAAFWVTAAAAVAGAELTIEGVGLNPRRTGLIDVLRRMGAEIDPAYAEAAPVAGDAPCSEPVGALRVTGRGLTGTHVHGVEIPNLIDELPLVAVAGSLANGVTRISDAAELRVKESDRIAATAAGLSAFGVKVEEQPDGMVIYGGRPIRGGADVGSHGDHRIAMAMAILALAADAPSRIRNVSCVATSYPGFWDDMERCAVRSA